MKTIINTSTLMVIVLLTSCSGSTFMNRKYTSGRFIEHKSNIKHNTTFVDSTKQYASLSHVIELLKPSNSLETNTDKEIINTITNSILKKDSVFLMPRRGKNKIILKRCNTEHVLVVFNSKHEIIKIKELENVRRYMFKDKVNSKNNISSLAETKATTVCALLFSFVPVLGFILSLMSANNLKLLNQDHPDLKLDRLNTSSNIAMTISSFITFAFVLTLLVILGMLLFGGGFLFIIPF